MYIDNLLMGLNGDNTNNASVALNLKIALFLLITTNVWGSTKKNHYKMVLSKHKI